MTPVAGAYSSNSFKLCFRCLQCPSAQWATASFQAVLRSSRKLLHECRCPVDMPNCIYLNCIYLGRGYKP